MNVDQIYKFCNKNFCSKVEQDKFFARGDKVLVDLQDQLTKKQNDIDAFKDKMHKKVTSEINKMMMTMKKSYLEEETTKDHKI